MNQERASYLFTSESVSEGHPDKVADRISDTVVDAFLAADPYARVACETLVTTNRIILAGEVRGPGRRGREPGGQGPRRGQGHRLRAGGLPLEDRRLRLPPARPVGRHRHGRRRRRQQGRGRRRPGHHVRLRHQRDAGADAGDPAILPQHPEERWPRPATRGERAWAWSPTPRARSPCSTRTASRCAPPRSCSRPSTARA